MIQIASYGGGVNSTAMLIGMSERGEIPDLILFADTGGEKPETYAYLQRFGDWLTSHSMPPITVVRKTSKREGRFYGHGESFTLEEYCLGMKTLPSIAYGFKTCSLKFKREPQDEFLAKFNPAVAAWGLGEKVVKAIGFDAGEPQRAKESPDERFANRYPLIEWGWDREECTAAIVRAGLCIPPKSSCFFCPNMTETEILELRDSNPELLGRALEIERQAAPSLVTIKGLGRGHFSWRELAAENVMQSEMFAEVPCECYDGE